MASHRPLIDCMESDDPKEGQWWLRKRWLRKDNVKSGSMRYALKIVRDTEERYFRYVAREYLLMGDGRRVRQGATVALSKTTLKQGYELERIY